MQGRNGGQDAKALREGAGVELHTVWSWEASSSEKGRVYANVGGELHTVWSWGIIKNLNTRRGRGCWKAKQNKLFSLFCQNGFILAGCMGVLGTRRGSIIINYKCK